MFREWERRIVARRFELQVAGYKFQVEERVSDIYDRIRT
jgi:hypothetical protein